MPLLCRELTLTLTGGDAWSERRVTASRKALR